MALTVVRFPPSTKKFLFPSFEIKVYKRNNEQLIGDGFFIFLGPLLPRNPNNGVDNGSIPTFDEKVSFCGECCCLSHIN